MKVILATPPWKTSELWPPLGILYLASSAMSRREDDVKVIDAFCENLSTGEFVDRVVRERPDVLGMNSSTHTFLRAMEAVSEVKKLLPDTKVVMGGIQATFAAERIVRGFPFVDFIIKGEAEDSFPHLLDCLERGVEPSPVGGISYLDDGRFVDNPQNLVSDLDRLPFPARELVRNIDYGYAFDNIRLTYGKLTTLCSSRGCPFQCTFCSCAAFSKRKWRPRSPENVVEEIKQIEGEGYESCVMVDDNLTNSKKRMEKMCELIGRSRVDIEFFCEGRVDNAPYSMLKVMKEANFNIIYFGAESASQHVLDYYEKRITPDQTVRAVENAKRAGMVVVTSFIIGAPGESREDIMRTIDLIKRMRPHALQMNILDCLLGTPIWEVLEREGIVREDDWQTNHRIYEYSKGSLPESTLKDLIAEGYVTYVDSWKNMSGALDMLRTLLLNRTARTVAKRIVLNSRAVDYVRNPAKHQRPAPP